jgi:hypothetical protein
MSRSVRGPDYRQEVSQPAKVCGWWVGPIWKLDGETCVCMKPEGHPERDGHECSCGSWFAGCGHPPGHTTN